MAPGARVHRAGQFIQGAGQPPSCIRQAASASPSSLAFLCRPAPLAHIYAVTRLYLHHTLSAAIGRARLRPSPSFSRAGIGILHHEYAILFLLPPDYRASTALRCGASPSQTRLLLFVCAGGVENIFKSETYLFSFHHEQLYIRLFFTAVSLRH